RVDLYYRDNHNNKKLDSYKQETEYTRNYYRKYLLPIIKEKNSNIHKTVQRLSESIEADESFLENEAVQMFSDVVTFNKKEKKVCFKIDLFKSHAIALQRRAFHLILMYLYDKLQ